MSTLPNADHPPIQALEYEEWACKLLDHCNDDTYCKHTDYSEQDHDDSDHNETTSGSTYSREYLLYVRAVGRSLQGSEEGTFMCLIVIRKMPPAHCFCLKAIENMVCA